MAGGFWKEVGAKLGVALTGLVNVFDPDRVVIGGGVAGAGEYILGPVRRTINRRAMEVQKRHVRIVKAKLGSDAGLVGAGMLVEAGAGI